MSRDRKNFEAGKSPQSAMTEKKKEDEKNSAKLLPFVEPQLFVAVEEANRRLKEIMKVTRPTERKYIERIKQLVEQITRTKLTELSAISRTIIPQLEIEVSGYVETFERALAEKEKEIEALKAELEALKSKTKN